MNPNDPEYSRFIKDGDHFISDEELAKLMVDDIDLEKMIKDAETAPVLHVVCPEDELPEDAEVVQWDETLKTLDIEKSPSNIFERIWMKIKGLFS